MTSPNTRARLINRGGKKVRAHRWIVGQHLGRSLLPDEHVHHINENPLDNRIENLVVIDVASHNRLHKQIYPDVKACIRCGIEFRVNPRKRARNKTCSKTCAQAMRVDASRRSRNGSPGKSSRTRKGRK